MSTTVRRENSAWSLGLLMVGAFGAYFCMYAFRKPIAALEFAGQELSVGGVELKTAFLIGQLLGYALSKYAGIIVCSSLSARYRARTLIASILVAELALVAFAVVPVGWKVAAMFVNGLPLGIVWGLVVRYIEGRRVSDVLLAGLSASFILASGVVKDTGRWMLSHGVAEVWVPAVTGALFLLPFVFCVRLLEASPGPDPEDELARTQRRAMTSSERRAFLARFGAALLPLILVYMSLTAYRDFRDNYGTEIFRELGYLDLPMLFTRTELPASVGVLVTLACLIFVRSHARALTLTYLLMAGGCLTLVLSSMLYQAQLIDGLRWMVVVGAGAYLVYVPVASVFFERLTAAGGSPGTAVFGIYLADALGYSGSVAVQLYRDLWARDVTRLAFFESLTWAVGLFGGVLILVSGWVLHRTLVVQPDDVSPG
jgi:hypothetical protein